jgi:hypothetical protein
MESFGHVLRWCIDHWKSWGVPTVVASAAAAILWLLARRKEWRNWRQSKNTDEVDSKVIQTLQNIDLWRSTPRPFAGADLLVRPSELAEALSLDRSDVVDSLERLERRGQARNAGGTGDNLEPYWHIVRR